MFDVIRVLFSKSIQRRDHVKVLRVSSGDYANARGQTPVNIGDVAGLRSVPDLAPHLTFPFGQPHE